VLFAMFIDLLVFVIQATVSKLSVDVPFHEE